MKASGLKDSGWVLAQIVLLAALLFSPVVGALTWLEPFSVLGWVLGAAGLGLAAWATWQLQRHGSLTPLPSPRSGARLLTTGCYRRVRHPVYSGLLLWALGTALVQASALHFVLVLFLVLYFQAKAAHEERLLSAQYPAYGAYAARTGRFFPR
jgi:protein-S-isoprenylcysteine O-methyltransferase Ste14